ncbi:DUF6602 domain-containing protein [Myxococcus xanthus]|uniref:DUF6602 domain-containing protein n=1 Tax=Myxococcus xanthus TaxID=34 RepID=UPI00191D8A24|nr:DUF6602 domain-containing protein [Myxococcus xanthus]
MLRTHMEHMERHLISQGRIPSTTGHTIHKGTPRETFVKDYLTGHLSSRLAIGSGEVIDANSRPGEPRPQFDIVIYKPEYPRLTFGGGITGFLVESVVATIEVKSIITKADLEQAAGAARYLKTLKRSTVTPLQSGYVPPGPVSHVVAYDGPAKMSTTHGWIAPVYQALGIPNDPLPIDENLRTNSVSPSLDGVFILGRGMLYYDNVPVGLVMPPLRAQNPTGKWVYSDMETGSLFMLFLFLTMLANGFEATFLNPIPYVSNIQMRYTFTG